MTQCREINPKNVEKKCKKGYYVIMYVCSKIESHYRIKTYIVIASLEHINLYFFEHLLYTLI